MVLFFLLFQRQVLIEAFNQTVKAFDDCKGVDKVKKETCTGKLPRIRYFSLP